MPVEFCCLKIEVLQKCLLKSSSCIKRILSKNLPAPRLFHTKSYTSRSKGFLQRKDSQPNSGDAHISSQNTFLFPFSSCLQMPPFKLPFSGAFHHKAPLTPINN